MAVIATAIKTLMPEEWKSSVTSSCQNHGSNNREYSAESTGTLSYGLIRVRGGVQAALPPAASINV